MPRAQKVALVFYLLAAVPGLGGPLVYLTSSTLMPYHLVAIDVPWDELSPGTRLMFLTFLKLGAIGGLGVWLAALLILFGPFRTGSLWARVALPLITIPVHLGHVALGTHVTNNTPAEPPVWKALVVVALLGVGAVLSFLPSTSAPPSRE